VLLVLALENMTHGSLYFKKKMRKEHTWGEQVAWNCWSCTLYKRSFL